jgi:hypothetical protein
VGTDDIVDSILTASSVACFLLSIIVACRKLPLFDRFFPLPLQVLFWFLFMCPLTHGFPSEMFQGMILAFVWSALALMNSYGLYRAPMPAVRAFAVLQFLQAVCSVFLVALGYVSACWRYYGHIVWNP